MLGSLDALHSPPRTPAHSACSLSNTSTFSFRGRGPSERACFSLTSTTGVVMRMLKIPKRSGGYRTICIPSAARKKACRARLYELQELVRNSCRMDVVYGFMPMRNPVSNAMQHIGYKFTISFDLSDFFDSVTPSHSLAALVAPKTLRHKKTVTGHQNRELWHKNTARQGLPTSPTVANLAADHMDREIATFMESACGRSRYTRYADDLCISFDNYEDLARIKESIPHIIRLNGFKLNDRKTTLQLASSGRRIITGVAVSDTGVHPTRAAKRRLRAAQHNVETGNTKRFPMRQWLSYSATARNHGRNPMPMQAWLNRWLAKRLAGLSEWCRLKLPVRGTKSLQSITESTDDPVQLLERSANRMGGGQ